MAITVIPRDTSAQQRNQLLISGLSQAVQLGHSAEKLELQKEQLAQSKLSGASNRAQQEALTEQASATAESTRIKNKVLNSLPKDVLQGIYTKEAEANKAQIFNLNSQINNMAKIQALETAKLTQAADVSIKNSQAELLRVKQSSAQVLQNFDEMNKRMVNEKLARENKTAEFQKMIQGMDPAGRVAATDMFNSGADLSIVGEAGLKASQEATAAAKETERSQRIAEKKLTTQSLQKSPAASKREAKTFGDATFSRRQNAEANAEPVQPVININFDKTPGFGDIRSGKKDFKIDYLEAKELKKEKEWLKGYEETFGEPFDIPESSKSEVEKAPVKTSENSTDDQGNAPSKALQKWQEKFHPDKTLVFQNGKWGVE